MLKLHGEGMTAREAVSKMTKKTGVSRKELYSLWISIIKENTYA
jgi:hypothetical protein